MGLLDSVIYPVSSLLDGVTGGNQIVNLRHTCDLWMPSVLASRASGDIEASEETYSLYQSGVRCLLSPTGEVDDPMIEGLTAEVNLFVLDKWFFAADCPVSDTWLAKFTFPGPNAGNWWAMLGNSQIEGQEFQGMVPFAHLLAKRIPDGELPPGVS